MSSLSGPRGIIMDKEARDVSTCIATAARRLGYYAENVSDYVDDPDRTNCLVRRYARFAGEPIPDRFIYENPHPDWVVLIEETIIRAVNFFRGTHDGAGVLVVNSARDPRYLLKFLPEHLRLPIAGVTPPPTEKDGQRLFPTGNFRFFRPVYKDKTPPCNHACPTGEQIQKYPDHVKHDRYLEGYLTI